MGEIKEKLQSFTDQENDQEKHKKQTEQPTTLTVKSVGLVCLTLKITKAGPAAILINLSEKLGEYIQSLSHLLALESFQFESEDM